jgi:hypothetical protein
MARNATTGVPTEVVIPNWELLRTHDRILIQFKTGQQQPGIVDEVFVNGHVLWIWPAGPEVRQLIHMADIGHIRCKTADYTAARLAGLLLPALASEAFAASSASRERSCDSLTSERTSS